MIGQEKLDRVYNEIRTPYKYGAVVKGTKDNEIIDVDCQGVFSYDNRWFMTYVSYNSRSEYGGYQTNLASSDNLIDWVYEGVIFKNSMDYPQCAAFPALVDVRWSRGNNIEKYNGKYWWSTMEGAVKGYEGEPMNIGLLSSTNPARPSEYNHEKNLLLTIADKDVRFGERGTLYKSNIIHDVYRTTGYEYVMFYNAKDQEPWVERIFMAVSHDMFHWKRYGSEHVLYIESYTITGDPQIIRMDDLWVMNLFAYSGKQPAYDTFAVSEDLVHWTLWNGKPTIKAGEAGSIDDRHAHKPWLVKHNDIVYHFYCARSNNGTPRCIALATSKKIY